MITLKDIAEKLGVSLATVSAVLGTPSKYVRTSPQTRKKIEAAAKRLGYHPNKIAQSMVDGKTRTVALMASDRIHRYSFSLYVHGLLDVADAKKYFLKIVSGDWKMDHQSVVNRCLEQRVEGAICQNLQEDHAPYLYREFKRNKIPIVLIESQISPPWGCKVAADEMKGGMMATEYLISLGHRRIAVISLPSYVGAERVMGYLDAMKKAGYKVPADYVQMGAYGEMEMESTSLAVHRLMRENKNRPTAIFCVNDRLAMIALRVAKRMGINIPQELSVMGFSNTGVGELADPQLTSMDQPSQEIGAIAMERLIQAMGSKSKHVFNEVHIEKVLPKLVIRESTQPPGSC